MLLSRCFHAFHTSISSFPGPRIPMLCFDHLDRVSVLIQQNHTKEGNFGHVDPLPLYVEKLTCQCLDPLYRTPLDFECNFVNM